MLKQLLLITAVAVFMFGCAKKQVVKPEEAVTPPAESTEEPSVRYSDWQSVPQLKTVLFEYDQSELSQESRSALSANADYLKDNAELSVLVEGYADERGTVEYNLALGQRRAAIVREYYGQLGVPLGRIGTISYGEERPLDPGHNEAAWLQNRRVETKVRSGK